MRGPASLKFLGSSHHGFRLDSQESQTFEKTMRRYGPHGTGIVDLPIRAALLAETFNNQLSPSKKKLPGETAVERLESIEGALAAMDEIARLR